MLLKYSGNVICAWKRSGKKQLSDISDNGKQRKRLLYLKVKTSQVNSGLDIERQKTKAIVEHANCATLVPALP